MIKLPKPDVYAYELATHSNTLQAFSAETMLAYTAEVTKELRAEVERLKQEQGQKCKKHPRYFTYPMCPDCELEKEAARRQEQAVPVARIRTWKKASMFTGEPEGHGEIVDWLDGADSLPDGEHDLFAAPQGQTELLKQALEIMPYLEALNSDTEKQKVAAIYSIKQHLGEA
jgi:hypothetical protein